MRIVKFFAVLLFSFQACLSKAQVPAGFKSIFNGKNLKGWHVAEQHTRALRLTSGWKKG